MYLYSIWFRIEIETKSDWQPVLRIWDVYPGSREICCHTFYCSHKFHKIFNYFIFEQLKKKIWAKIQKFGIRKKPIPDPGSRGQKGTGSRFRIRNTVSNTELYNLFFLIFYVSKYLYKKKFPYHSLSYYSFKLPGNLQIIVKGRLLKEQYWSIISH